MIVVADSSPITALLHLKKLDLLTTLYGQIFIPHSVASELATLQNFGFDLSFLLQTDKFIIRRAADENLYKDCVRCWTKVKQKELLWQKKSRLICC